MAVPPVNILDLVGDGEVVQRLGSALVGVSVDAETAANVAAPESATRAQLDATYTARPSGTSLVAAAAEYTNVRDFGAQGDLRCFADGVMTAASDVLTCASYTFTAADVGKLIKVRGAGAAGASLTSTITSVAGGHATLADVASTSVTGTIGNPPEDAGSFVFGTDDTAAITAAFTAASAFASDGPLATQRQPRTVWFPQGCYLFTQIEIPRRVVVRGDGWGNYGSVFGFGFEQTNNTLLYQKWGVDDDAIIFTRSVTGLDYVISDIADFSVQQDLDNTAGNGISYRDAAGNLLTWSDGNRAENVAVYGFADHGWNIPAGMVPGALVNCRALGCGGAGVYLQIAPNGSVHEIIGLSVDQCGLGALYVKGASGITTKGVLRIDGLKYEATANVYRTSEPRGNYAITFEAAGGLRVSLSACEAAAGAEEATAPTALIRFVAGAQGPNLGWSGGLAVRVLGGQTGTPVLIDDLQSSKQTTLRAGVGPGCYLYENEALIFGNPSALNLPMVLGDVSYNAAAVAGESGGSLQIAGGKPVLSLFNKSAASGRQHAAWVHDSDGTIALRTFGAAALDETVISHNRPGGVGTKILKLGTATGGIGFFGAAGVVKPTGTPAPAVDPATTMALVNALRQALIDLGLIS